MNVLPAATDPFRGHLADFVALQRDVALMLSEIGTAADRPALQTHYAVDFTEVYAYAYPDLTMREVRLFSDESHIEATQQLGVNEHLLDNIFFGHGHAPVLLSPYTVELQRFSRTIHDDDIMGVMEAAEQLKRLRSNGHLDEVLNAYKSRPSHGLTDSEVKEVLEIAEKHSPLLSLLLRDPLRSVQRFRYLLTHARFQDARELAGRPVQIDRRIESRWYEKLVARRGEGRAFYCEMDALAVAQLAALNEVLQERNMRLRLITRSRIMHQLFQEELEGDWQHRDPHMLCHPRGFLVHPEKLDTASFGTQALATLAMLRDSLQFLARSGALVRQESATAGEVVRERGGESVHLQEALRTVKVQWHLLINLVLSTDLGTQVRPRASNKAEHHRFARRILILLSSDARIRDEVQKRVTELGQDLTRRHEHLPYSAQLSPETVSDYLERRLSLEQQDAKATSLAPKSLRFVNYRTIQFYTASIRDGAAQGADAKSVITRFLKRSDVRSATDYERRLAMAYLLAVNDYWDLAENYCELAKSTRESGTKDVPRHEVHYLLAICKRRHEPSIERWREGLRELDRAQQLKPDKQPDPRYLAERAALILAWRSDPRAVTTSDTPSLQAALEASKQAIALLDEQDEMLVPIYNNLCYAFLHGTTPAERHQAHEYYKLLIATLKRIEPRRENWPPGVLDTVVCAELDLAPEQSAERLRSLLADLHTALKSPALAGQDRPQVLEHCQRIEAALAAAMGSDG